AEDGIRDRNVTGVQTCSSDLQKVWKRLYEIPYGETISYKMLAEDCGGPTYSRAVANANGKNPVSIIVPCHRVIAHDGSLGGYTGGVEKRERLLDLERRRPGIIISCSKIYILLILWIYLIFISIGSSSIRYITREPRMVEAGSGCM